MLGDVKRKHILDCHMKQSQILQPVYIKVYLEKIVIRSFTADYMAILKGEKEHLKGRSVLLGVRVFSCEELRGLTRFLIYTRDIYAR